MESQKNNAPNFIFNSNSENRNIGEFNPVENFSNKNFENRVGDLQEVREQVSSAFDKFSRNYEQTQTPPSLPAVQDLINGHIPQPINVPGYASDKDLMEDEWVSDLKKMIVETKGDPRLRQTRFKQMQVDYLRKRYGRIINGGK